MTQPDLLGLVERYLETCDDLKEANKRKKEISTENAHLKETIMQMMRAEKTNKIEYGATEVILKTSKRTKSLNVSQVVLLMEEYLQAIEADDIHEPNFVESIMDDFLAAMEARKDVTEADSLQVKRAS